MNVCRTKSNSEQLTSIATSTRVVLWPHPQPPLTPLKVVRNLQFESYRAISHGNNVTVLHTFLNSCLASAYSRCGHIHSRYALHKFTFYLLTYLLTYLLELCQQVHSPLRQMTTGQQYYQHTKTLTTEYNMPFTNETFGCAH